MKTYVEFNIFENGVLVHKDKTAIECNRLVGISNHAVCNYADKQKTYKKIYIFERTVGREIDDTLQEIKRDWDYWREVVKRGMYGKKN